jgi:hypothetical protein
VGRPPSFRSIYRHLPSAHGPNWLNLVGLQGFCRHHHRECQSDRRHSYSRSSSQRKRGILRKPKNSFYFDGCWRKNRLLFGGAPGHLVMWQGVGTKPSGLAVLHFALHTVGSSLAYRCHQGIDDGLSFVRHDGDFEAKLWFRTVSAPGPGEGNRAWRGLTEATGHDGGTMTRACHATAEILLVPERKAPEQVRPITG